MLELNESFDWNGHTVRWVKVGSGPPMVLCHGTPWSSFVWRTTATKLSDIRTVYLWAMIGYGQSAKPDDDVSLRTQGQLLT